MERIARFEKVSFEQFKKDYKEVMNECGCLVDSYFPGVKESTEKFLEWIYSNVKIPERKTIGSAGYDFVCPVTIDLLPYQSIKIPTGIKCYIKPGWVLAEFPRSSLGFKYRMQFDNTVGIIDSDYYNNPSNEGHIFLKITNDTREDRSLIIDYGDRIAQGIFLPYGITFDDEATGIRTGGIGSTGE